jgi:hypothetical protein
VQCYEANEKDSTNNKSKRLAYQTRKGVFYFQNGDKYDGEWRHGQKNGNGTLYYNNGEKYIGEWRHDKKSGNGIHYYKFGETYEGEWRNDMKHGKGIYKWKNGNTYEGEWKNDLRYGKGIYHYNDGNKYDGEWKFYQEITNKTDFFVGNKRLHEVLKLGLNNNKSTLKMEIKEDIESFHNVNSFTLKIEDGKGELKSIKLNSGLLYLF